MSWGSLAHCSGQVLLFSVHKCTLMHQTAGTNRCSSRNKGLSPSSLPWKKLLPLMNIPTGHLLTSVDLFSCEHILLQRRCQCWHDVLPAKATGWEVKPTSWPRFSHKHGLSPSCWCAPVGFGGGTADHHHPNHRPDKVVTTKGAQRQLLSWLSSSLTHLFCHFLPLDFSQEDNTVYLWEWLKSLWRQAKPGWTNPRKNLRATGDCAQRYRKVSSLEEWGKGKKTHLSKRISFGEAP